jgi:hypothetical protein
MLRSPQKLAYESASLTQNGGYSVIPASVSIATSFVYFRDSRGSAASCNSFADNLSVRAVSTGLKTRLFSFWLFAFFELARALFAIADL